MKSAIVLMPFADELKSRFSFICDCAVAAGVQAARVDTYAFSGNILSAISRAIAQADLVIADLSRANANVAYEVAVAQCMGKRVVLLTDDRNTVPFDLLSHRTELVADTSPAVAESLTRAIRQAVSATYVTGPLGGNVVFGQRVFIRRTAAFAIDVALLLLVAALLLLFLNLLGVDIKNLGKDDSGTLLLLAYAELAPFLYFTLLVHRWGSTLGQRLLDLRVVSFEGERPTFARAAGRTVASILSIATYGIGFLWCLRGPGYRTFHDIASGTMVIRREGKPTLAPV